MTIINRLIPWLSAFLIFLVLEQILQTPKQIYWLAGFTLVIKIFSIWYLSRRQFLTRQFFELIITPVIFLVGGLLFIIFLQGSLLKQFLVVVLALFSGVYLEVIFLRFQIRPKYQPHSLENIVTHLGLLALFFIASGLFSIIVFLGVSLLIATLIFAAVCLLLSNQLLWVSDTTLRRSWPFAVVVSLVETEIFLVVAWLPTSVYVSGFIVALCYYLVDGLSRNWLLGIKEAKVFRRYLIIAGISLITVLVTAKWF